MSKVQTSEDVDGRLAQMLEYKLIGLTAKDPAAIIRPEDKAATRDCLEEWRERCRRAMSTEHVGSISYPFGKVELIQFESGDEKSKRARLETFRSELYKIQGGSSPAWVTNQPCDVAITQWLLDKYMLKQPRSHGTIIHVCSGHVFDEPAEYWFAWLTRQIHRGLVNLQLQMRTGSVLYYHIGKPTSADSSRDTGSRVLKTLCGQLLEWRAFRDDLNLGFLTDKFEKEFPIARTSGNDEALVKALCRAMRDMVINIAVLAQKRQGRKEQAPRSLTVLITGHDLLKTSDSYEQILALFRNLVDEINFGGLTRYLEFRYMLLQRGTGPAAQIPYPVESQLFLDHPPDSDDKSFEAITRASALPPQWVPQLSRFATDLPADHGSSQPQARPSISSPFSTRQQSSSRGQLPNVQRPASRQDQIYGQRPIHEPRDGSAQSQAYGSTAGPGYGPPHGFASRFGPGPQQTYGSIGGPAYAAGSTQQGQPQNYQPSAQQYVDHPFLKDTLMPNPQLPPYSGPGFQQPQAANPRWATDPQPATYGSYPQPPQQYPPYNNRPSYGPGPQERARPDLPKQELPFRPTATPFQPGSFGQAPSTTSQPRRKGSMDSDSKGGSKEGPKRRSSRTDTEAQAQSGQQTNPERPSNPLIVDGSRYSRGERPQRQFSNVDVEAQAPAQAQVQAQTQDAGQANPAGPSMPLIVDGSGGQKKGSKGKGKAGEK